MAPIMPEMRYNNKNTISAATATNNYVCDFDPAITSINSVVTLLFCCGEVTNLLY